MNVAALLDMPITLSLFLVCAIPVVIAGSILVWSWCGISAYWDDQDGTR